MGHAEQVPCLKLRGSIVKSIILAALAVAMFACCVKIYRYDSRNCLISGKTSCAVYAISPQEKSIASQSKVSTEDKVAGIILAMVSLLFAAFFIFLAIGLQFARCIIGAQGIEITTLFDERGYSWKDIARFDIEKTRGVKVTIEVVRVHLNSAMRGEMGNSDAADIGEGQRESFLVSPGAYGLSAKAFLAIIEQFRPSVVTPLPAAKLQ